MLFSAGLQVPVRALGRLVRRPKALLAGLVLHFAIPLAVVPFVAFLLRRTPDTDGGSGLLTAMILVVAMPVAAGATVWTDKGDGDQPTMVGLVLASTLLSPLTTPLLLRTLVVQVASTSGAASPRLRAPRGRASTSWRPGSSGWPRGGARCGPSRRRSQTPQPDRGADARCSGRLRPAPSSARQGPQ
ncbi:hypothetical protein ACFWDQ_13535 [Streptomyces sp. NPDC060053]|uniref:hypothetical protein n=1 Tax=Streptomyces sp. NPDC060053 TaxID=3347047 RepID=UPI0036C62DF3